MKRVRLSELSKTVRSFLAEAFEANGVVIEDDDGRARGSLVPYRDPTAEEEQQADASLEQLRAKTAAAMKKHGVTEEDIMQELLRDD